MTMIHKILIAGFAAAAIGSGIYSIHLQKQIGALQQQQASLNQQISQLSSERDDAKNQLAALQQENEQLRANQNELLRLRGEVGVLRQQLVEKNRAQNVNAAMFDSNTNSPIPQIHIKARFLTMPEDVLAGMGGAASFSGILTSENASNTLQEVELHNGVQILAEPEVITTSGRQTEMRATQIISVVTNFCLQETNGNYSIVAQDGTFERGPVLDVMPKILSDGYIIELSVIASVTDFMGYAQTTNTTAAYTTAGQKVDVPTVSPQFDIQQTTNSVNLLDGQTMVFALNDNSVPADATLQESAGTESKRQDKATLVFVTANIVDSAGNRVHSDSDNYTNIPPQPDSQ